MSLSPNVQRAIITCSELGVDYEIITVDLLKGEQKSPEYVETKNPFGSIPVLLDEDGTQIFESRAVCRYLVAKYGAKSGLVPDTNDLKSYGLFEQAASIEYSSFSPSAGPLTFQMAGKDIDENLVKQYTNNLNGKMEGYERILSRQKYLAGNNFTLADLFHLPEGRHIHKVDPSLFGSKPNVKRWWDEISSRASLKALN
ncbi:GST superfamily [Rhizoctonia solani]|uniref:glutathione transferase n=1 Tax=Rhizoctonia solani TaxID=456999 RepID=A0A8H7M4R9_9AGAM|nr:GST superfamily [Rhizoctonia solani]